MYGCESWTMKKAERWRIDAFEVWCWRRLLRVPWTARISNQSILKEISSACSFKGLMLKLKIQYLRHLMQRVDSLEKTLMLGGTGGRRRRGRQRMRWPEGITDLMDGSLSELLELVMLIHGVSKNRTRLSYWNELNSLFFPPSVLTTESLRLKEFRNKSHPQGSNKRSLDHHVLFPQAISYWPLKGKLQDALNVRHSFSFCFSERNISIFCFFPIPTR